MSDRKLFARNVNFVVGVPSLGSMLSMQNTKGTILEVGEYGVTTTSKKTGRKVLVPYANIRGIDLIDESTSKPAGKVLEAKA